MSSPRDTEGEEAKDQINSESASRETPIQQNKGEASLAQVDERGSDDDNRDNDNNSNKNKNKQTSKRETPHKNQKRNNKQKKGTGGESEWGDKMGKKTNEIRVAFQNINGLPKSKQHPKNKDFVEMEARLQVDVLGISEVNLYWPKVDVQDQLQARTREWWQTSHTNKAFLNEEGISSHFQPGGTAIMSIGQVSSRVIESGKDKSGMGRWTWTRYQGKNEQTIRIAVAYRPNKSTGGPMTVHAQQRRHLLNRSDDDDPRERFWGDLQQEVQSWMQQGDHVVVGGDFNEDVRGRNVREKFREMGLQDAHDSIEGEAPATYNGGSKAIDGVFISPSMRVTRKGYLAFGDGIASDHRCIWLDISPDTIGIHRQGTEERARARRLQHQNPRTVKRYLQAWKEHCADNRLREKIKDLQQAIGEEGMTEWCKKRYEEIDKCRIEGILKAERSCRKLPMGKVPWTPAITAARERIRYWTLLLTRKKGRKVSSRMLSRLRKSIRLKPGPKSKQEAEHELKMAHEEYKSIKKKAMDLRKSWLHQKAEAIVEDTGGSVHNHIKVLQRREEQRRVARTIKAVRGKTSNTQIWKVTSKDGRQEIDQRNEVEKAILEVNAGKIKQAHHTPMLTAEGVETFGRWGATDAMDSILQGLIPSQIDQRGATGRLLRAIEPPGPHRPPETITVEAYRSYWRKAREFTTSGPSGLHFGHLKAHASDQELAEMDVDMINIPMATGYAPIRWTKACDAMLLKKEGVTRVDKLRTIVLFEADFNYMNKFIGREMMRAAERNGTMADEQYGSRTGRKAIDQAVNKRLFFDILRQRKIDGAICSNDAASCYDRIVHSAAAMAMRRQGISREATECMFKTLQQLEHKVKTGYGVSSEGYSGRDWQTPPHGVGQGNGAGPSIWAAVSSLIIEGVKRTGLGTTLVSPSRQEAQRFIGFSYVDDADLTVADSERELDPTTVQREMQLMLDEWEELLRATGGSLAPEKSYWSQISFKEENGKWRYRTKRETGGDLRTRNKKGEIGELEKLEPWEARTMLGVDLAPDGNEKEQIRKMENTAQRWADAVRTGQMRRSDAWEGMRSTVMKSLEYPLPSLTLTRAECDKIIRPVLMSTLPAGGVVRTMPRTTVYGPKALMGLGVPNLYVTQGVEHIRMWIDHCLMGTTTGKLLQHSLEAMTIEVGGGDDVWECSYETLGHLASPSITKATWRFLQEEKITLDHPVSTYLRREGDTFIMDEAVRMGWRRSQLAAVNAVRLWMGVMTVSDISTLNGREVTEQAVAIETSGDRREGWPRAATPIARQKTEWRKLMRALCGEGRQLREPLREWRGEESFREWEWVSNRDGNTVYQRTGKTNWGKVYRLREMRRATRAGARFETGGTEEQIPEVFCPVSVGEVSLGSVRIKDRGPERRTRSWESTPPQEDKGGVDRYEGVRQAVSNGAVAMTDGSFKEGHATAAWGIKQDPEDERYVARDTEVSSGHPVIQSAYRAELTGILALIRAVHASCGQLATGQGGVEVGCDCLSAITVITQEWEPRPTATLQGDLVYSIRTAIRDSNITWTFRHVRGHQDDGVGMSELDGWAKMNVDMDEAAKGAWVETRQTPKKRDETVPWRVEIDQEHIVNDMRKRIVQYVTASAENRRRRDKDPEREQTRLLVDTRATADVMSQVSKARQVWATKWHSGQYAHGVNMKRWGHWVTDQCPRCGKKETASHLLRCTDNEAVEKWDRAIGELERWMVRKGTAPDIVRLVIEGIKKWRSPLWTTAARAGKFPGLSEAQRGQETIGWERLFYGELAKGWVETQQRYNEWIRNRRSARRWGAELLKKCMDIAWDQWQHRNGILHDKEKNQNEIQQQQRTEAMVREEFEKGADGLLDTERQMMRGGPDRVLRMVVGAREQWIRSIKAGRKMALAKNGASGDG